MTNTYSRKRLLRGRHYTRLQSNQENPHNIYNVSLSGLRKIFEEKDRDYLHCLGGPKGLAVKLDTGAKDGVCEDAEDISQRRNLFGSNTYDSPPAKRGLFYFVLEAFRDPTIVILLACATILLGHGLMLDGITDGLYKGGSIFFAVFLVIAVSAISNFRQSKQSDKLSSFGNDIKVDVVRNGQRKEISIFDIVVGDVVILNVGDQIPADGLFLEGNSLQIDESITMGGSDQVDVDERENPYLYSRAKVVGGSAIMLVTSVGMNTAWGKMMSSINHDANEQTPLRAQLNILTSYTRKVGLAMAFLVLVVLLALYFTGNTKDENGNQEFSGNNTKFGDVIKAVARIVAVAATIVVAAIPEGLQLAETLILAYSMKRMMADQAMLRMMTNQAMLRKISTCETMGSITDICTDKTGTVNMNQMKVTKFWLGQEAMQDEPVSRIPAGVLELLHQGIGLNTTDTVYRINPKAKLGFSSSPYEKVMLSWANSKIGMNVEKVKRNCAILCVKAIEKKRSGIMMSRKNDNTIHVHWKGAAEKVLAMCSNYWEINGNVKVMNEDKRIWFQQTIQGMTDDCLSYIAFAHTQIPGDLKDGQGHLLKEEGLTLLGIVGIENPYKPGVRETVQACKDAGVNVKMITADDVPTARAIATKCGILKENEGLNSGAVVEGVEFQNYTKEERMDKVGRIQVMARSSPFHKLLMVQCLKQKLHVVAVTGNDTSEAAALKEADIGLSTGIRGTEEARNSDNIILDDNFTSMEAVLLWGRCVYNNIQKYIQFQLTVNLAAVVINLVAAVFSGRVPLTAVQLLWVNLIVDTLGAVALATEHPTQELMKKPPVGRTKPLITNEMWRNLLAQALYQIVILLILQFRGKTIFGVNEKVKDTLIFNSFVLCQVFNGFNVRRLEKKNVFEELHEDKLFMGIIAITIILQVVIVEFLNKIADTERLNWGLWGVCIGMATMSWPIGFGVKFIPISKILDSFFANGGPSLEEGTELQSV